MLIFLISDRVLYARKAGEGEFGSQVDDGEKISQETACVSSRFPLFVCISFPL